MRTAFKSKKTIIVLEDDEILLDTYDYFINSYDDFVLKGMYKSVDEALKNYKDIYPDIIISDISMPGMSGIDGIEKFRAIDNTVKIIMISVHDDLSYILDSIKNRTDGYLTKPVNKKNLWNALKSLEEGGAPLSNDVSRKLIETLQMKEYDLFSKRENQIVTLFTKGHTYKSIADKLFISASTVNFHIQKIYYKLNVNNKSEALKKLAFLNTIS